ncbi:nitric oxide synthase oxygenase [Kibdelosporangium persicum]|nr:nitric oxide synthase oxygenase [Kibdelosporangium persicum]
MTTARNQPQHAPAELLAEACTFLASAELRGTSAARLATVREEITHTGTYAHTADELTWGARIAWRNATSCLGRAYWRALEVRDRREVTTVDELAEACVEHLRVATNGGRVRLTITVGPAADAGQALRVLNHQLVGYAGHLQADGSVVGDPKSVWLTQLVRSLGWSGTGGRFDVLPLVIQRAPGERPWWYRLPRDVVMEVPLSHPDLPWFEALGLRWYAHPAISHQRLRIGGVDYPAAPFSGWYTATEISAENLARRYSVLPEIAQRMGLDTTSTRTLWLDRALVELTTAVLHSYQRHGVIVVDHHHAAKSFSTHENSELAAGRPVYGRYSSLVAPTAAATTDVYYRSYRNRVVVPNFFPPAPIDLDPDAANGALR